MLELAGMALKSSDIADALAISQWLASAQYSTFEAGS